MRLRAGFRYSEGRVEIFREGVWGTICDDNWDLADANVVCRQAGFGTAFEAVHNAAFGRGVGRVSPGGRLIGKMDIVGSLMHS